MKSKENRIYSPQKYPDGATISMIIGLDAKKPKNRYTSLRRELLTESI